MTRLKTMTATAALAGATALFAAPASAMTCEDFNGMSEEAQQAVLMGIDAGREEAREMARGDNMDDGGDAVSIKSDDDMNGGREEAREDARGAPEVYVQVVDNCGGQPDMKVTEAMKPAATDGG